MLAGLDGGSVAAILPEGAAACLALVERLRRVALDQLHAGGDLVATLVAHDQVNVIAGGGVVQDTQSIAPPRFVEPVSPQPPVTSELEKELAPVTAVGEMPDVAEMNAVRTRHERPFLTGPIPPWESYA